MVQGDKVIQQVMIILLVLGHFVKQYNWLCFTAVGKNALYTLPTGRNNVAVGLILSDNTTGKNNVSVGHDR